MNSFKMGSLVVAVGLLTACKSGEPPAPTPIPAVEYVNTPTPLPPLPEEAPAATAQAPKSVAQKPAQSSSAAASSPWSPSRKDMQEALEDYGTWSTTREYGDVWTPARVPADWRPYTNGHWVHADEGWLWQASEPWGWLPYHYGRWVFLTRPARWAWVPGVEWAPAQVVWRADNQYVAWAPRPPGRVDIDVIPSHHWIVVPAPRFLEVHVNTYIVPPARVVPIVRRTPVVTVTRRVGPDVLYVGPNVTVVTGWGVRVPPPVHVSVWRAEVPVRYKAHCDKGLHKGWYRPVTVVAAPRGAVMVAPAPPPPRGTVVVAPAPAHHGKVKVEKHGRGREVEVEVDRGRHGSHKEVEVRGPRRTVEVEVDRHGDRRVKIDAEREKRRHEREKERAHRKHEAEKEHR